MTNFYDSPIRNITDLQAKIMQDLDLGNLRPKLIGRFCKHSSKTRFQITTNGFQGTNKVNYFLIQLAFVEQNYNKFNDFGDLDFDKSGTGGACAVDKYWILKPGKPEFEIINLSQDRSAVGAVCAAGPGNYSLNHKIDLYGQNYSFGIKFELIGDSNSSSNNSLYSIQALSVWINVEFLTSDLTILGFVNAGLLKLFSALEGTGPVFDASRSFDIGRLLSVYAGLACDVVRICIQYT